METNTIPTDLATQNCMISYPTISSTYVGTYIPSPSYEVHIRKTKNGYILMNGYEEYSFESLEAVVKQISKIYAKEAKTK